MSVFGSVTLHVLPPLPPASGWAPPPRTGAPPPLPLDPLLLPLPLLPDPEPLLAPFVVKPLGGVPLEPTTHQLVFTMASWMNR
jgi:hypothetical protein